MRHGAHRPAHGPDARLGMRDEPRDLRMLEVTRLTDGRGEVERADEHQVDALDGGDLVDVLDRPRRLDLAGINRFRLRQMISFANRVVSGS